MANRLDFYLGGLLDDAEATLAIERIVRSGLPRELGKRCSVGRLSRGLLPLYADNGAAASKIRQYLPSLSEKLRSRGVKFDMLKVMVRVHPQIEARKREKPVMAKTGVDAFKALAGTLRESPLKSSVEALVEALDHEKDALDDVK